ncbi:hypothetical protein B0J12DRAFT_770190 [Macrophomina phaseolina]|uniref:Uncharacterized protein n=1 Tax=Macrophomina phaseolina TaxID=35725 RepID=A0ABQ8GMF7_9PEZI|nr:hypothetical protein B0J12DRAFT_770190 [Macrophomina phaseolina]
MHAPVLTAAPGARLLRHAASGSSGLPITLQCACYVSSPPGFASARGCRSRLDHAQCERAAELSSSVEAGRKHQQPEFRVERDEIKQFFSPTLHLAACHERQASHIPSSRPSAALPRALFSTSASTSRPRPWLVARPSAPQSVSTDRPSATGDALRAIDPSSLMPPSIMPHCPAVPYWPCLAASSTRLSDRSAASGGTQRSRHSDVFQPREKPKVTATPLASLRPNPVPPCMQAPDVILRRYLCATATPTPPSLHYGRETVLYSRPSPVLRLIIDQSITGPLSNTISPTHTHPTYTARVRAPLIFS